MHAYHYLYQGPTCFFLEEGEDLYLALVDLFTLGASGKEKHPKSIGCLIQDLLQCGPYLVCCHALVGFCLVGPAFIIHLQFSI
jgi:hypothetical protein